MYNSKSVKSEEFIDHEEIMKVLEYGEKNKDNSEMVDEILKKAESLVGLDRYEAVSYTHLDVYKRQFLIMYMMKLLMKRKQRSQRRQLQQDIYLRQLLFLRT